MLLISLRTAKQASPPPPPAPPPQSPLPPRPVWWFAPFLSGGGMGQEALQLVLGLYRHTEYGHRTWISSHGDTDLPEVWEALPPLAQHALADMAGGPASASLEDAKAAIIVCHSEPGAWALPTPLYETSRCPPLPVDQAAFVVARSMWESDRLPVQHVAR